ncbi:MocR-like pyridoxine biosynthesis transcription factor PdxR [Streptomyces huiliensis]|uniref:MocR-like pyridoxine biosynthesis transcription factor PdxR n=1 Tax=Streptomyces huiliensis TaxID=2876027 RepID=UPI001CBFBEE2|nr:PLP-dependent aminotransferase family protein [Streptomyces huiliensis]MBZ4323291.1 PLP-dependent aminotransferase family protein [Streptomyces huiliensis]
MDRSKERSSEGSIGSIGPMAPGAAGSDFLQLDTGDAPPGGLADWLTRRLREAIADGRLPVGSRLPPSRLLAGELRLSRGVVIEAYRRLTEDGHAAGRGRHGTFVVAAPTAAVPAVREPAPPRLARPDGLFTSPGADAFDALRAAPARIDLSPGLPDLAAFPRAAWLAAERAVLGSLTPAAFGYGDPRGTPELRRALVHWLARTRGIVADPDEVIVVGGVAQAMGLVAQVLVREGIDEVAVEDPGSLGARQHFRYWGAATPPVPVDAEGVRVDALRATGARAVLLTPAHQFPTGVVLGGARRRALMDWVADGGLVLEDDYDAEHRYDRPPVAALRAMLADGVCYMGSVSKLFAPALRLGWLLAPARYREALVDAKRFTDLGSAALPQLALARLLESGELERHLRQLRRRHRRRRDAMIEAIGARLPGAVVHGAAAGLHLMVTFEGGPDDAAVAAAALERGVKVQPLSWHSLRPRRPGLVLGYAVLPASEIAEGVATVAEVIHDLS